MKSQIKTVKQFSSRASEIVRTGVPDQLGQLLVDEFLDHLAVKKHVRQI